MKTIIIFSICLIFGVKSFSQNITIKEPEYTGVILLVKDTTSFEKLEKQKASVGTKASVGAAMFGIVKAKGINVIKGISSPVRTKISATIRLIVKVKENDKDPVEVINIFQLEQNTKKNNRVLIVGTANFNKTSTGNIKFIPFESSKYGKSSYLIEISNLPIGEYAITLEGSRGVFNLFGVD